MLVLTRKPVESIVVGDSITVTVLEVKGGRVKLGIQAPASVSIRRSELSVVLPDTSVETPAADWAASCV